MLWLTWGGGNAGKGTHGVAIDNGSASTASISVADDIDLDYSCTVNGITLTPGPGGSAGNRLTSYRPGNYTGDSLDDMYNIGGTGSANQLVAGMSYTAGTATFNVQCSALLNGMPIDIPGLVIADAESINTGVERVEGTASGSWNVVDLRKNLGAAGGYQVEKSADGGTVRLGPGNDNNTAAVSFLKFTTPSPTVDMSFRLVGGGTQAIAIGILSPYADFSDAPASYGTAMQMVQELRFSSDGIANGASVNVNTAGYAVGGLLAPSSDFIGTLGPDTERMASFSANAMGDDIYPLSNPNEENGWPKSVTPSILERGKRFAQSVTCAGTGTVAGWIDFDANGTFDADERAAAVCSSGAAVLDWLVTADAVAGETFVRLRYSTVPAQLADATGVADDGEVEDHRMTILGPQLSISKTNNAVSGVWSISQPDAFYRLVVRNNGPVATGGAGLDSAPIAMLDDLPVGIVPRWTGTLSTNGWACTASVQLVSCTTDQILGSAGTATSSSSIDLPITISESFSGTSIVNHASVAGGRDPFNNGVPPTPGAACTDAAHCATNTVRLDWSPELTLEKTAQWDDSDADGRLAVGDVVTYAFKITNTGKSTLTNVSVADTLSGLVLTGTPIASLAPGEVNSTSYTAQYVVAQADVDAGNLVNTATAEGTPPAGSGIGTPIKSNISQVTLPPDQSSSIKLTKAGAGVDTNSNGRIDAGEFVDFTFTVTNSGKVSLTNVTIDDAFFPAGVTGGPIAVLAAGASDSTTFTGRHTVTQVDIDAGSITNTATAEGSPPGTRPRITSEDAVAIVPLETVSSLSVVKTSNWVVGTTYEVGATVTYAFTVTNTGNVTISDITIADGLAGIVLTGAPITLAPGASDATNFTASYVVTQLDADRGAVTNIATASGNTPTGDTVSSPPSTVTVPPDQLASITIAKRFMSFVDIDGSGTTNAGDIARFGFDVTNIGQVTLTDVTVVDALPQAVVSGTIATLAPAAVDSTLTADVVLTQVDIDAGELINSAIARGSPPNYRPPVDSPPSQVTTPLPQAPALTIAKTGSYADTNGDAYASGGDTLTYSFKVTNTGDVTLAQVSPVDLGPKFDGIAGEASLSAFTPRVATLVPGGEQIFTATYVMTQNDADRSAGKPDAVTNEAAAKGTTITGVPYVTANVPSLVTLPSLKPGATALVKTALTRQVRRGEQAAFRIELTNNSASLMDGLRITDTIPPGFRYVDGSATLNGTLVTPSLAGQTLTVAPIELAAAATATLELKMLALASVTSGTHTNYADAFDRTGAALGIQTQANVEVLADAIFECTDIIGKVFDDKDQDGYQDEGELGLPASRLVTARGTIVTTDRHGRYSIPCADVPNAQIGSNFILKLDERSLPTGFAVTTENPDVVRLTAGKMAELNFGAALGREVRLDLAADAFVAGTTTAIADLSDYLPVLIEILKEQRTVLRLNYSATAGDTLAEARLDAIKDAVTTLWNKAGAPYELITDIALEWH